MPVAPASPSASPPARLVACGLTTLDVTQVVDRLPGPDEKVVGERFAATFGGPAANAAAVAVALGVPTTLVTAIGAGAAADVVRAELLRSGVEVVDLAADVPDVLPVSTVLVTRATGQRAVVSVNGARAGALPAAPDPRVLDGAGVLLVDGHHPAAALALAGAARTAGVPVLLDGGSWKPTTPDLLALVDLAVLSADLAVPGGAGTPRTGAEVDALLDAVAAHGPAFVARSAGAGAVRVRRTGGGPRRTEVVPAPVPAGDVVDTLGAGDVLHGAMAAALARGDDALAALGEGVRCATASVRAAGARGWLDDGPRTPR